MTRSNSLNKPVHKHRITKVEKDLFHFLPGIRAIADLPVTKKQEPELTKNLVPSYRVRYEQWLFTVDGTQANEMKKHLLDKDWPFSR